MKVIYTPTARRQIEAQLIYLVDRSASSAPERLRNRITAFITGFLVRFPRASRFIAERSLFETWIPRTPYVVLYRVDDIDETLTVLALFHGAQDRSQFTP